MKKAIIVGVVLSAMHLGNTVRAQQVPDVAFDPEIGSPAYSAGKGPVILVDEAHHNFHTIDTRYQAFAKMLGRDGYKLKPGKQSFSSQALRDVSVLVIANAIHPDNDTLWAMPVASAFSTAEISTVEKWVREGGSLLLIADHMPFPGAARDLAKAFGFTFFNGFATDTTAGIYPGTKRELDLFTRKNATLAAHRITDGKSSRERVESVATFTGQAFQIPPAATSLLTFDERFKILLPDTAWKFNSHTRRIPIKGFSQGAVMEYGKGRIAVFGEAAMFTAQRKGKGSVPFGLNSPDARQNLQFLLNLIHWLDREL